MFHRPLIPILLSYIGGIIVGQTCSIYLLFSLLASIFLLIVSICFFKKTIKFLIYCIIFFLLGNVFHSLHLPDDKDTLLLKLARARKDVVIEGTILNYIKIEKQLTRIEVRAERIFYKEEENITNGNIQVTIYNNSRKYLIGERIRFPSKLRTFRNFNNPGRYDYEFTMKNRGLVCSASVSDGRRIVSMGRGNINLLTELRTGFLKPVRELFNGRLDEENRILYNALILGERHEITSKLREPFDRAGIGHILAVSGLHVGLIAWLVFFVSKYALALSYYLTLKANIRKIAAIITCIPIVWYTFISGFLISTQRAMIMVLVYLLSIILGREKEIWSTLALAALCVLALDPNALFSISFQLSFIAVIGILWLVPIITKRLPDPFDRHNKKKILRRIYDYIGGLLIVTFSAAFFLLPITTFYFNRISLVSIVVNLLIVPILGICVIPLGLLSTVLIHIFPPIAEIAIDLGDFGLGCILNIIRFWSNLEYSSIWMVTPNLLEICLFYSFLFFLLHIGKRKWAKPVLFLILVLITADLTYWIQKTNFNRNIKVTYFDVGQGNSALIQFPGRMRMLIDGGGFSQSNFDIGRMVVAPCLWHSKIRRVDFIVLTHPQSDHLGGLNFIASNFSPKEFWYNGDMVPTTSFVELMKALESNGIDILLPHDLLNIKDISDVEISLLHPLTNINRETYKNSRELNNNSMVLKITYRGNSFLFPGDIESAGEKIVIKTQDLNLKSDVLLSPHHGSRGSNSMPFLKAVSPMICVISSGGSNYFGFPHKETIERLNAVGCEILRIDRLGAIRIVGGDEGIKTWSYLEEK